VYPSTDEEQILEIPLKKESESLHQKPIFQDSTPSENEKENVPSIRDNIALECSNQLETGSDTHLTDQKEHQDSLDDCQVPHQSQDSVHPSLEPFFVIDTSKKERIFANTTTAYQLDTEYFKGQMMILIRTPNVDEATHTKPEIDQNDENSSAVNFFREKLRRFEFQFQVKLKRVPVGRVYFACELQETITLGVIQRAFVGAAMAFVKSTNKSFHYSLSGTPPESDGSDDLRYEAPHMAFPVEEGMNRVIATPPGQTPPPLGGEIFEDPESIKKRKKGFRMEYNTSDTYTFSLWSQYVDFLEWRCLNLPGIRPFSISSK
jgi:Protein of unknown function (DUF1769)